MAVHDRGIGSEGLEQGGPNLGNDYTRKDLNIRDAGDALTSPNTTGLDKEDDDKETLNMDKESSRNLDGGVDEDDDDVDDIDLDDDDLDDDLVEDDLDEEDDELDKGL